MGFDCLIPDHCFSFCLYSDRTDKDIHHYCTARQCSPLRRKFMECYIIHPAQSLLMKRLVIGQR